MHERFNDGFGARQRGFALILAILALLLLTFLGLTLATTTSTELQIATNYRWSQQAYYNAEAGLEVAKLVMLNATSTTFMAQLPAPRAWTPPAAPSPVPSPPAGTDQWSGPLRDYEGSACDTRSGMGYGWVLRSDPPAGGAGWQNVTNPFGAQSLNGAFTLWVRRELTTTTAGAYQEDTDDTRFIVTSEGTAPYEGSSYAPTAGVVAFASANRAVRVLQATLSKSVGKTACQDLRAQGGYSSTGAGFAKCANLTGDSLIRELGSAKTDTGAE